MELYIAGGCGEHGRCCFYVKGKEKTFLVDCGTLPGAGEDRYPRLSQEQIDSLDLLFLTSSRSGHAGALSWLLQRGFDGPVIASRETLSQLPLGNANILPLDHIGRNGRGRLGNLEIQWGRSGHCTGSVWYKITEWGKSILFSGAYTEKTVYYRTDPIREVQADLALLDCAYGRDSTSYEEYCETLLAKTAKKLAVCGTVIFPVPYQGRGLELLKLFSSKFPETTFWGDARFLRSLSTLEGDPKWRRGPAPQVEVSMWKRKAKGILFLADPQLRSAESWKSVNTAMTTGAVCYLTGSVEPGSESEHMVKAGTMEMLRYPVHQNYSQYQALVSSNVFSHAIPCYSSTVVEDRRKIYEV